MEQGWVSRMARAVALCAAIIAASTAAYAQALSSLSGTVSDASGSAMPNASVTVEDINRGLTRNVMSDEAGRYAFPQIPPGKYKLTAKMTGFNDVVIESIELQVNSPATVNIEMKQISGVAETVTVSAQVSQVNATDASLGNAIGTEEVLQLPMYLRNVVGLLTFQPGVTSFNTSRSDERNGSVNGGRSDQANVTLDGIDVNDHQSRLDSLLSRR